MTNLVGIRLECQEGTNNTDEIAYAYKDVSGLGIILPLRVTIRMRLFDGLDVTSEGNWLIVLKMGGASDNLYQIAGICYDKNDAYYLVIHDDQGSGFKTATTEQGSYNYFSEATTPPTEEDWIWLEVELDSDNDVTVRFKNDNTTTRPATGWTKEYNRSGITNITPSQELQEVYVYCGNNHGVSSTDRIIMEIDEIYVTQD